MNSLDIDKILLEWSYRIQSGIPNTSSEEHLKILEKVLSEYKVPNHVSKELINNIKFPSRYVEDDQVVEGAFASNKKSAIRKAKGKDIETIINHLTSNKLFDQAIIDQMLSLVQRDQKAYYETIDSVSKFNIDVKYATEIADAVFSYPDPEKFVKYIKNRSLTIDKLHGKTLISVLKGTGINKDFLSDFANYQWVGSPAVGTGEVALAVLLKNGGMAAGPGDVQVGSDIIEIKGSLGRLKGQHGFESGLIAAQTFSAELRKLAKKLPKDAEGVDIPKAGGTDYNMTGNNWAVEKVGIELIKQSKGKIKASDLKKVWTAGFKAMYVGIKGKAAGFMKKAVNQIGADGSIKDKGKTAAFIVNLFSASIQHYMDNEDFTTLVILERGGKMAVLQPKDVSKPLSKLSISSLPQFSSRAGSQGAAFQVKV